MKEKLVFCPLCAAPGAVLHDAVSDYYFGSPGRWSFNQCSNACCGVAWPSPTPDDSTLAVAYGRYYTHEAKHDGCATQRLRTWLARWAYLSGSTLRGRRLMRLPIIGRLLEDSFLATGGIAPMGHGRILDIGCGSGDRLALFSRIGWGHVAGVELDPSAVNAGIALGRDIWLGSADRLPFDSNTVDVAVLHHVIEHVRDSAAVLSEAFRVLKPGQGRLAVVTPNIASLMRQRWGQHWRGFEAPRHLTIFTVPALQAALTTAGFVVDVARTSGQSAAWIDRVSAAAAGIQFPPTSLLGRLISADRYYREQERQIAAGHHIGDEIVMIATRPANAWSSTQSSP